MKQLRKPHRLLLVDDQQAGLFAMGDYLAWTGFQVDMASALDEAQALLAGRTYAAVVADLNLVGDDAGSGLEVIATARANSSKTRIVLMSASFVDPEDPLRHGADLVLQKPQPLQRVADCLIHLLEGTT
jgi:two-component system OmpR family response regulator